MNIGGGLRYVTAPMGGGKSLYAVKRIMTYLIAGKYVVTNVRLYDDFAERAAAHIARTRPSKRPVVADRLRRFYIYETDLAETMRYRFPGKGETRALMVWDEAHNDLNNRSYRDRDQSLLEWATQLRKLGLEGILISQSHENTDAQLRRICNYIVRVQNQRETMRVPLLNTRAFFMPRLFLAYWYMTNTPAGSRITPVKVERYFMGYAKDLYDTMDLYHGVEHADVAGGIIRLPEGGIKDHERRQRAPAISQRGNPPHPMTGTPRTGTKTQAPREKAKSAGNLGQVKNNGSRHGGAPLRVVPPPKPGTES